jgi:hypothetical protein
VFPAPTRAMTRLAMVWPWGRSSGWRRWAGRCAGLSRWRQRRRRRRAQAVGAFHLGEQCEQDGGQLGHWVGGAGRVDFDGVGEVVDQVQGVAHGPSEPVEGVDHDDVAVSGVLDHRLCAGGVGGGAGLLVEVDPLGWDSCRFERDDLPVQVLFGRRNPRPYPRSDPRLYRKSKPYG